MRPVARRRPLAALFPWSWGRPQRGVPSRVAHALKWQHGPRRIGISLPPLQIAVNRCKLALGVRNEVRRRPKSSDLFNDYKVEMRMV